MVASIETESQLLAMKEKVIPFLLLSILLTLHPASAILIATDDFDEAISSNAPTNWVTDDTDNDASLHGQVVAGSLDYSGLAPSVGNSFGLANKTADYNFTLSGMDLAVGETVYMSFLLRTNVADASFGGNFRLFANGDPFGNAISIGWGSGNDDETNMGFSLNNRNRGFGHVDSTPTGENYSQSDVVLVVSSYTRGSTNTDGSLGLWINPDASSFGGSTPPTADVTIASYQSDNSYDTVEIVSAGSGSFSTDWQFDELRIGTDWADVTPVPEPEIYALGIGAVSLLLVARRRLTKTR